VGEKPVTLRATIPAPLAGERLDKALASLVPELSRTRLREIITRGGVWIHDVRLRKTDTPVEAGVTYTIVHPPGFAYPTVTIDASHVLWEDRWLIAFNKQSGWYVQPTAWDVFGNLEYAVVQFLTARDRKAPKLHLTHRLDRETSGVLILAKAPEINAPMQKLWGSGGVSKRYLALVGGEPPAQWVSDEPLGPGPQARHRVDRAQGKPARTEFRRLAAGSGYAELEAQPRTGRTHQIRIHAAHAGYPLLGDERYGGARAAAGAPVARVMLHAAALAFPHPRGGAVSLAAPPPADYAALRDRLFSEP
jgi:23S rRNA pseudouridine1911/1915/1917 synthase